jgi:formylglycine-generating enzyme required for sulfatase activity
MRSPFKFLDSYTLEDKDVFFGRDKEVNELYDMIYRTSLLLVYGYSGTGKTSLIKCGLENRLEGPEWYPLFINRKENINQSFRAELNKALDSEHEPGDLSESIHAIYDEYLRPVFLFFDQFEELFILGSVEEQEQFFQDVKTILDAKLPCKIIFIIREEFLGRLYNFEQLIPSLRDFRLRVEPMSVPKVKEVMAGSFGQFNISLESAAEERMEEIIDNIREEKADIQLPFLQVYLDRLYRKVYKKEYGDKERGEELPPLKFSREDIAGLGAIQDVLGTFLEEQQLQIQADLKSQYPDFPEGGVLKVLDAFVTDDGTKRPVPYKKGNESSPYVFDGAFLEQIPSLEEEVIAKALDQLAESRILKIGDETIELAHDSLALRIFDKRTDEQKRKSQILREIRTFRQAGQLFSEKLLLTYSDDLEKINLSQEDQQFIADSQKQVDKIKQEKEAQAQRELELANQKLAAEQKVKQRQRIFLGVVSVVALFAIWQTFSALRALSSLDVAKQEAANTVLEKAYQYIYTLDYEEAVNKIREADNLNPTEKEKIAYAYLEPAFFYAEAGKVEKAVEVMNRVVELVPKKSVLNRLKSLPEEPRLSSVKILEAIREFDPALYEKLKLRYYPQFVPVSGGQFLMGYDSAALSPIPPQVENGTQFNLPLHEVQVSDLEISRYETTWWQYHLFCETTSHSSIPPSWGTDGDNPVNMINWYDAIEYANWLSERLGFEQVYSIEKLEKDTNNSHPEDTSKWTVNVNWKANGFRLPTEAEWEYAAKEGEYRTKYKFSGSNVLDSVAWHRGNSGLRTRPVGQLKPNRLGLYDMTGNVMETCWDWVGVYPDSIMINPKGPKSGRLRVVRRGGWLHSPQNQTTVLRGGVNPGRLGDNQGIRLVRNQ